MTNIISIQKAFTLLIYSIVDISPEGKPERPKIQFSYQGFTLITFVRVAFCKWDENRFSIVRRKSKMLKIKREERKQHTMKVNFSRIIRFDIAEFLCHRASGKRANWINIKIYPFNRSKSSLTFIEEEKVFNFPHQPPINREINCGGTFTPWFCKKAFLSFSVSGPTFVVA